MALASCSSDGLVNNSSENNESSITFNVGQKNITRDAVSITSKLETQGYFDFGVWAYKTKSGSDDVVMNNYQVGCSGYGNFSKENASQGTWFYDGLNSQVLRYWDFSTEKTDFFAYAPHNTDVKFDADNKQIKVPASINKANTSAEIRFIYAGNSVKNSAYKNPVSLNFKRLSAIVNLKFWTDINGYTVELIDANPASIGSAIQATPTADKKDKSGYYDSYEALIDYNDDAKMPTVKIPSTSKTVNTNLKFALPAGALPTTAGSAVTSGTTYYAVAQPTTSTTGFTFHVSYKLTAIDNSEVITVRDARVFVPASGIDKNTNTTTYIAAWQPNTKYTYTFKITTNTNGKTSIETINLDDPSIPNEDGLYPIVFDNITIEDITDVTY
jgi:hypothetical protein